MTDGEFELPNFLEWNATGGRLHWSAEGERELLALHQQGKSRREMADALGTTRNAIIGKLNRLGKVRPRPPVTDAVIRARLNRRNELASQRKLGIYIRPASRWGASQAKAVWKPSPRAAEACTAKPEGRSSVTILELGPRTCRWPLWAGRRLPEVHERFYCGARTIDGTPYCATHFRMSRR